MRKINALRRMTSKGVDRVRLALSSDDPIADVQDLLADRSCTEIVAELRSEVTVPDESTRMDVGVAAASAVEQVGLKSPEFFDSMWTWFSAHLFSEICPRSQSGACVPGEQATWISESGNWKRFYRHRVAGPWWIVSTHRSDPGVAAVILCQQAAKPGDVVAQLAGRQELVSARGVMELATRIYYDSGKKMLKHGAASKGSSPGSVRRLVAYLNQIDLTYDLQSITADELQVMLPREFHKFLSRTAQSS